MPSANQIHKRKRATDGPNHPDRKKKTKPRFKKMKPSAYHSSSEEEPDEKAATGGNSIVIGARKSRLEAEKNQAEESVAVVSGDLAADSDADDVDSEQEEDLMEVEEANDEGVQLPNLQDDEEEAEDEEDDAENDEFDIADAPSDSEGSEEDDDDDDDTPANSTQKNTSTRQTKKRNDPSAFASSISAILSSKLTTTKRADPVLARSATAASNAEQRADIKLEAAARRKLTHDKKALQDRGHVRDVLGTDEKSKVSAAAVAEHEKKLRKMAQRGVVKLFNAVRAAQVKGEEARAGVEATPGAVVGIDQRSQKVTEMSKQGFLDLLVGGS